MGKGKGKRGRQRQPYRGPRKGPNLDNIKGTESTYRRESAQDNSTSSTSGHYGDNSTFKVDPQAYRVNEPKFTLKEFFNSFWIGVTVIVTALGVIATAVGVIFFGYSIDKNVTQVDSNVEKLADKIDKLKDKSIENSGKLSSIQTKVFELDKDISSTNDIVKEIKNKQTKK